MSAKSFFFGPFAGLMLLEERIKMARMAHLNPLTISSATLSASVLTRGAALTGLRLRGLDRNLVLGFADPDDHARIPVCAGSIVGPVANRITAGQISIAGETYQMPLNEDARTCLHSGPEGLHVLDWEVVHHGANGLQLGITLEHGDQGLPGRRRIEVTYAIKDNTLTLDIIARTDRPTPVNIAHHPYWNLAGADDVSGHRLSIAATHYTPTDPAKLPTGQIAPVKDTVFDFTMSRPVPLSPALDINYCLDRHETEQPRPAAVLVGPDGMQMALTTSAPGLQVYNGASLPARAGVLTDGGDLRPFGGIALEPQFWPDAPHHPNFPKITLHPGTTWRQTTAYTLSQLW